MNLERKIAGLRLIVEQGYFRRGCIEGSLGAAATYQSRKKPGGD